MQSIIFNSLLNDGMLYDYDGNPYSSVVIGDQEWIAKNLITSHYADGSPIPNIEDNGLWVADASGAMCCYNNDPLNMVTYGGLYNWYAVSNPGGLAYFKRNGAEEVGWRVPDDDDFANLSNQLGGDASSGGHLREVGTDHWNSSTGADNLTGFTGRGGGIRSGSIGTYEDLKNAGYFNGDTSISSLNCGIFALASGSPISIRGAGSKHTGRSIRCMRDI